jgi:Uma2 family endonuclease
MSPPSTTTLLQEFLAQPNIEASPAWELIDGHKIQKPMPTLFHSRLQRNLMNYINAHAKGFEAIQEFRCLVPPYSPVPNISAVAVERLPQEDGPLEGAPDWLIEIRSPDQGTLDLQNKILHCLNGETQLAWLIDISSQQVWVWRGDELPIVYAGSNVLPTLGDLPELTAISIMAINGCFLAAITLSPRLFLLIFHSCNRMLRAPGAIDHDRYTVNQ